METEQQITKKNCKFLTKAEICDEIRERLKQNNDDVQALLTGNDVNNIDELLSRNATNNEFDDEICEYGDIESDNDFLKSILHFLEPKAKKKRSKKQKKLSDDENKAI